ncbi:MAG TPA: fumarylacetoacetate hydrolase family protein [Terriglobales bacterium]|nr:fumarylacetoacetate hydrolase family protein [Terriglobales bacterium]
MKAGDRVVAGILAARKSATASPAPSEAGPLTLAEAYDVQDQVRQALVAGGERVVGWKVGFTSRATQQAFATTEPAAAFLLGSGVYASGAEVPAGGFIGLAVEAEVALVMGRALAGPGVTPPQALLAVEGAVPALELIDFRYAGKPTAIDAVADGVFAKSIVLGAPLTDVTHLDLALEGLVYELSGAVAATNTAAEVLGSPINSLAWIANHLGARGLGLRAGDVVMTGSVSVLLRPKAGDTVRARFTRLGSVSARFV